MKAFGERPGGFLIAYDAEEFECVLPHQLVNLGNFDIRPLCAFRRDERQPWATAAVQGLDESLVLLKDDKQDVVRLGERLAAVITPVTAEAALTIVSALDPD